MLQAIRTAQRFSAQLNDERLQGRRIALVPTMGALHHGHLSLMQKAAELADVVAATIFVNRLQFNQTEDFDKYPRTLPFDLAQLSRSACRYVLAPADEGEIYGAASAPMPAFQLGSLGERLEGRFRPGHFAGMAAVVYRLFVIAGPCIAVFGQKDLQQFLIIEKLVADLHLPVELHMAPTVREPDGLAMSSRNSRLTPQWRAKAPALHRALCHAAEELQKGASPADIQKNALQKLRDWNFQPEYFDICNAATLMPVSGAQLPDRIALLVVAWAGDVRLIDNLIVPIAHHRHAD